MAWDNRPPPSGGKRPATQGRTPRDRSAAGCPPPLSSSAPHVRGEPGAKSFVDDLILAQGFVRSRAATSLRSIESHPLSQAFVGPQGARVAPGSKGGNDARAAAGPRGPSFPAPRAPARAAPFSCGRKGGRALNLPPKMHAAALTESGGARGGRRTLQRGWGRSPPPPQLRNLF